MSNLKYLVLESNLGEEEVSELYESYEEANIKFEEFIDRLPAIEGDEDTFINLYEIDVSKALLEYGVNDIKDVDFYDLYPDGLLLKSAEIKAITIKKWQVNGQ